MHRPRTASSVRPPLYELLRSEHATADMFKELMKNNAPVDVEKALAAGGGIDDAPGEGVGEDARSTAKELLMRLPGINVHNYRQAGPLDWLVGAGCMGRACALSRRRTTVGPVSEKNRFPCTTNIWILT